MRLSTLNLPGVICMALVSGCLVIAEGDAGPPGQDGTSCTIVEQGGEDGLYTIRCGDEEIVLRDGHPGDDGDPCRLMEDEDGQHLLVCGESSLPIEDGEQGPPGEPCAVTDHGDGSITIQCPDSPEVTLRDGERGADGEPCSIVDNQDDSYTITCGENSVTLHDGQDGDQGPPGEDCIVTEEPGGSVSITCGDNPPVIIYRISVNGLTWQDPPFSGTMTWEDATQSCEALGEGWRLPTVIELIDLLECGETSRSRIEENNYSMCNPCTCSSCQESPICSYVFDTSTWVGDPPQTRTYWSISLTEESNPRAWTVNFNSGQVRVFSPEFTYHARCIRGGLSL